MFLRSARGDTQPKLGGQWRTEFLATNYIRALQHPPYSLDLVPADYSLFWRIKSDLADVSIIHETFKTELERVLRSIGENEFTGAFKRWLHCHEKCIALQGGSVEKSLKIKFLLSLTVFVLLDHSHLLLNTPRTCILLLNCSQYLHFFFYKVLAQQRKPHQKLL
jgi:hypothetical protein